MPRRLRYKGTRKARLWRLRAKAVALALALGAATSGCSLSYKLNSFMAKDADLEHTGSIGAAAASPAAPAGTERAATADNDLVFAKAAATDLLARPEKGVSRNWENPRTGARGTVTAVAEAYTSEGFKCRDFLASYMRDGSETWLQGDACRIHQGKWTVRSLQPLKRPS